MDVTADDVKRAREWAQILRKPHTAWHLTRRQCDWVGDLLDRLTADVERYERALRAVAETLRDEIDTEQPGGVARNLVLAALGEGTEHAT